MRWLAAAMLAMASRRAMARTRFKEKTWCLRSKSGLMKGEDKMKSGKAIYTQNSNRMSSKRLYILAVVGTPWKRNACVHLPSCRHEHFL